MIKEICYFMLDIFELFINLSCMIIFFGFHDEINKYLKIFNIDLNN